VRAELDTGGVVSDLDVERARGGDVEAFVALIERRQERMVRVASAILGNRSDADDAIQETLVSVWRELPGLRVTDRFDAWADRILVNACRQVLRRRRRRSVREIAPIETLAGDSPGAGPAHDVAVATRDAFGRAFDTLDVQARALLVLRHLEDRSIAEIAEVLSIPEGTVKSRLFAARRSLESALAREERG
jgi:RNA polymerase sigma-70 factor (ECF subfamily)